MIAFATCVGSPATFTRCAAPGLRRAMESDSLLAEVTTEDSIHAAYNEILAHFAGVEDLEALVLLHEDTELLDRGFCGQVRRVLADEQVAIAGVIGGRAVHRLEWWAGPVVGRVTETRGTVTGEETEGDVDAVDGLLMVLSPWAVRSLRCDTDTFTGFHAYDVDLCLQARAAGRRVVAEPFAVFHHASRGKDRQDERFVAADAALRAKWQLRHRPGRARRGGRRPGTGRPAGAPWPGPRRRRSGRRSGRAARSVRASHASWRRAARRRSPWRAACRRSRRG